MNILLLLESTRLELDSPLSPILEASSDTSAADPSTFTFCVPDEWYRRPTSRTSSMAPSESTLRRLSELEAIHDEDEGTAKQGKQSSPQPSSYSPSESKKSPSPDSSGTFSSRRFSSLFDGWLGSNANTSSVGHEEEPERKRPIVSEPVSLIKSDSSGSDTEAEQSVDEDDFEHMIVSAKRC